MQTLLEAGMHLWQCLQLKPHYRKVYLNRNKSYGASPARLAFRELNAFMCSLGHYFQASPAYTAFSCPECQPIPSGGDCSQVILSTLAVTLREPSCGECRLAMSPANPSTSSSIIPILILHWQAPFQSQGPTIRLS